MKQKPKYREANPIIRLANILENRRGRNAGEPGYLCNRICSHGWGDTSPARYRVGDSVYVR